MAAASPQRGFLGGLRNFFGGGQGRDYLVTWKLGGACTSFTRSQGVAYCRSQGMRPISLDTPAKEREFTGLVGREGQKYFWTGGNVNHGARTVSWPSGRT